MRGDPPLYDIFIVLGVESTPHARGSTGIGWLVATTFSVYPACAGIHPKLWHDGSQEGGLPRMRGDPPYH